jgi:hypothetical protein
LGYGTQATKKSPKLAVFLYSGKVYKIIRRIKWGKYGIMEIDLFFYHMQPSLPVASQKRIFASVITKKRLFLANQ